MATPKAFDETTYTYATLIPMKPRNPIWLRKPHRAGHGGSHAASQSEGPACSSPCSNETDAGGSAAIVNDR